MTRPSDAIGAFEMLAARNEWGDFRPDAARQILAYIKELEDQAETYHGVITTARGCCKTQMVQLTLDQHLKRAAQDS